MAPPRRFALELPGCGLAHFAVGGDAPGARLDPRVAALLGPPGRSYSLCVPEAPGGGCAARVRAARLHQRLLHQLRRDPLRRCQLRRLLCYGPGGGAGGVQRGFLLRDPGDSPDTRRALFSLLGDAPGGPRLGEFVGDAHQQVWQSLWELRDGAEWRQVGPSERVLAAPEPALHPVVPDLPSSGVFPHREAARAVLEAVRGLPLPRTRGGTPPQPPPDKEEWVLGWGWGGRSIQPGRCCRGELIDVPGQMGP